MRIRHQNLESSQPDPCGAEEPTQPARQGLQMGDWKSQITAECQSNVLHRCVDEPFWHYYFHVFAWGRFHQIL